MGTGPAPAGMAGMAAPRDRSWLEIGSGRQLALLVGVLFALNLALYWPGAMMNDSLNQYKEAVSGRFTDWHPPVMAWLWSVLRRVHDGPAPLFALHLCAYWAGIAAYADAARRLGHRRIALALALSGAFPAFVFMNAYVIKDVGMAAALVAGSGLLFWFRSQGRRPGWGWAAAAALLLAYGTLVRTNAVFAIGPLLAYAMAPDRWLRPLRLGAVAVVVALAAVPGSMVVNQLLFHPVQRHAVESLFLYDIAGTAAQLHEPALLAPRARMSDEQLQACYSPFWWDSFSAWGPCGRWVARPDPDRATYGEGLAAQWLGTIAAHPLAWAEHRLKHFNSELFFLVPLKHMRFAPEYRGELPGFTPYERFTPAQVRMDLVRKNPTVWPITWLAWGAALLVLLSRCAPSPGVLAARPLLVSALAYSGAYLLVGVATDLRYHYWSLLASVIATLLVGPELAVGWRLRSRGLWAALLLTGAVVAAGLAARLFDLQAWVG